MSKFASAEDRAEAMGYDCGRNGPDLINCAYNAFLTPEESAAWERGKARADAERHAEGREP